MNNILLFKKENSKYNEHVIKLFKKLLEDCTLIKSSYKDEIKEYLDELNFFEKYINELINKVNNNSWKNEDFHERYIEIYNYLNSIQNEDIIDITFKKLIFTYISDVHSKLIKEDNDYIVKIVKAFNIYFSENNVIDKNMVRKKLALFTNDFIKDKLNNSKYIDNYIVDIIYSSNEEEIISNITSPDDNNEDIKVGILTIDRIYKYYLNQINSFIDLISESANGEMLDTIYTQKDSINNILFIKKLDNNSELNFIRFINEVINNNYNLEEQLELVSSISDIYNYYKESIKKMDYDMLKSLIFYKAINNCDMIEVDDFKLSIDNKEKRNL